MTPNSSKAAQALNHSQWDWASSSEVSAQTVEQSKEYPPHTHIHTGLWYWDIISASKLFESWVLMPTAWVA